APEDMRIKKPCVAKPGGLGLLTQVNGTAGVNIALKGNSEFHKITPQFSIAARTCFGTSLQEFTKSGGGDGIFDQYAVLVGTAVEIEVPRVAHFLNHVQVHIADDQFFVPVTAQLADELTFRVAEVTFAVEVIVTILLNAHAVNRA